MINAFIEYVVTHNYRETNKVAYWAIITTQIEPYCDFEAENLNLLKISGKIRNFCRTKNMGGRRKRCDPKNCQEWKKKLEIWDILDQRNFMGYLEKLKGSNPSITRNFLK